MKQNNRAGLIPEEVLKDIFNDPYNMWRCEILVEIAGKHYVLISLLIGITEAHRMKNDKLVDDFDNDRWDTCSTGIHHFLTREEAVNY